MFLSFVSPTTGTLSLPEKPEERRVTVALLCSAGFHAVVAIVATVVLALSPLPAPVPDAKPVLQAVLRETPAAPAPVLTQVVPEPIAEPPPAVLPETPVPTPPPPRAAPAPAPAPPSVLPVSNDPNGNVTVGMMDPASAARLRGSDWADRFPQRVDKEPRLLGSLIVGYPLAARQARLSGRVAAIIDLDEHGRITNVAIAPDHPLFGPAIVEALKEARFSPAELASKAVPFRTVVEFAFAIAPASSPNRDPGATSTRPSVNNAASAGGSAETLQSNALARDAAAEASSATPKPAAPTEN